MIRYSSKEKKSALALVEQGYTLIGLGRYSWICTFHLIGPDGDKVELSDKCGWELVRECFTVDQSRCEVRYKQRK